MTDQQNGAINIKALGKALEKIGKILEPLPLDSQRLRVIAAVAALYGFTDLAEQASLRAKVTEEKEAKMPKGEP